MLTKFKKGFSLIEVMLLFTVLAVFMAASLPTITRHSRPIPTKAAHGVYRCFHDQNGVLKEYLFSSSKAIYGNNGRVAPNGVCTFNVPTAAMYKVDLYSAGAGGTKYAKLYTNQDDNREANYNLSGIDTNSYKSLSGGSSNHSLEPLRQPTDEELSIFDGLKVIKTTHTGDAGNGGFAELNYETPYGSECHAYNDLKEAVESVYNKYYAKCEGYQTKYNTEQGKIDTANSNITTAENHISGKKSYNYWSSVTPTKSCENNDGCCYYCNYYTNLANEAQETYDKQKAIYDSETSTQDEKDAAEKAMATAEKDKETNQSNAKPYCNGISTCISNKKSDYSSYSGYSITSEESTIKSEEEKIAKAQKEQARIQEEDYKPYACSGFTGAKSSYGSQYKGGDLYPLTIIGSRVSGVGDINSINNFEVAAAVKEWWESGQLSKNSIYNSASIFDLFREYAGVTGFVDHQYKDFCKAHFPNFESGYVIPNGHAKANGGDGGKGKYLRVTFPIKYVPSSLNGQKRANYLKNIVTDGHREGFYVMTCKDVNEDGTANSADCRMGNQVQNGASGNPKTANFRDDFSSISTTGTYGTAFSSCVSGEVICDQKCTANKENCTKDANARRSIRQFLKVQDPELFFADEAYNTLFDFNSAVSDMDLNALDGYNADNLLARYYNRQVYVDEGCDATHPHKCNNGDCISCDEYHKLFDPVDCTCQCYPPYGNPHNPHRSLKLINDTTCEYGCKEGYKPNPDSSSSIPCLCLDDTVPDDEGKCPTHNYCYDVSQCGYDECWQCNNHRCEKIPKDDWEWRDNGNGGCYPKAAGTSCSSDSDCYDSDGRFCQKCNISTRKCVFDSNNSGGYVGIYTLKDGPASMHGTYCHYGKCNNPGDYIADGSNSICRQCSLHKDIVFVGNYYTQHPDKWKWSDPIPTFTYFDGSCRTGKGCVTARDCGREGHKDEDAPCWDCIEGKCMGGPDENHRDELYGYDIVTGACIYQGCPASKHLTYSSWHYPCECMPGYPNFCSNEEGCIKECTGGKEFDQEECECKCPEGTTWDKNQNQCVSDKDKGCIDDRDCLFLLGRPNQYCMYCNTRTNKCEKTNIDNTLEAVAYNDTGKYICIPKGCINDSYCTGERQCNECKKNPVRAQLDINDGNFLTEPLRKCQLHDDYKELNDNKELEFPSYTNLCLCKNTHDKPERGDDGKLTCKKDDPVECPTCPDNKKLVSKDPCKCECKNGYTEEKCKQINKKYVFDEENCTCTKPELICPKPQVLNADETECVCPASDFEKRPDKPYCKCKEPNHYRDEHFTKCYPCKGRSIAAEADDPTYCSCAHIEGSHYDATKGDCFCDNSDYEIRGNKCVCVKNCGREYMDVYSTNGQDVVEYVAFHIPDLMHSVTQDPKLENEKIVTAIKKGKLATGGHFGQVRIYLGYGSYLDNSGKMINVNPYENDGLYIVHDYAHSATIVHGAKGDDTEFTRRNIAGRYDNGAVVDDTATEMDQEPRLKLETKLWSKYFELGQSGEPGVHKHFVTTNLGRSCSFTVPRGGQVLNLMDNGERPDIAQWEDNLAVIMTCRNAEDETVFSQKIAGGKYSLEYKTTDKYWWSKQQENLGRMIYGPYSANENINLEPSWAPTSIWAKAYKLFMGASGQYDLNRYRISYAGQGTRMTDLCVIPRGTYRRYMVYVQNGAETKNPIHDTNDVNEAKGFLNGVQCYPANNEGAQNASASGQKILYDTDPLIRAGVYQINATAGGGGAVVITW